MTEIRQDAAAEPHAGDRIAARARALVRPLGVGLTLALVAVPAGLAPWQAIAGYGAFAAALLLWPSSREDARARARARARSRAANAVHPDFAVIEALDLPTIVFDRETQVVRQNSAARLLVGDYPDRASLSARIRSPSILELVARVVARGLPESVEHSERVPSERWHEVRVAPVNPGAEPDKRLYVLTYRDLTEARRMDRMRTDFVANASHELRTPLASLMGFIETLQGPARNDEAARTRFFGIMLEQAQRMARLIDDLLSLSRLEMRAHVAPEGEVDLERAITHVVDTLKPMANDLGVTIELALPEEPVVVTGDVDELIQVFSNLIENACKYGQAGKRVLVTVAGSDADGTHVTVQDFGPGIAKEHVPRLTERFYRVDVESSRTKKGTGLGLAIVKHILARHRARLVIRSVPGEGSAFTVKFSPAKPSKSTVRREIYQ
ncbi:MAG: phosphate regulon sensor histidine kinase PhoR [Hoeflea sp.]|uniref:phosphate regulon sensor histidine kinase PhoR n=1 Tax=Hoeflea sp. TaxID=1940281 RepID=UPI001D68962A|nr:phosphate regulon sensor histidine kinase PhoR [Hoeflea sp.]MBU4531271.1 phosphate regulon sensor histidine kinase PhoR [Alphaproteobacteria bacterium]MBU4545666.1 phosphate regulon sensor histidine kinase PhoR [Alphaproteobacteria bacterium]MBU4550635.1 phosphate regulon sensor histidine kinase PhoR [Alphaproteobacteria bacterium]MBV1724548.1 phosphate regulon sensor histidine kinase PhoR [Hoeflea sp.]MBV1760568.1 phosphate regulon sensor histidine kinase PhoR [Hoeflea sp.]